jgi:hypothetical protein
VPAQKQLVAWGTPAQEDVLKETTWILDYPSGAEEGRWMKELGIYYYFDFQQLSAFPELKGLLLCKSILEDHITHKPWAVSRSADHLRGNQRTRSDCLRSRAILPPFKGDLASIAAKIPTHLMPFVDRCPRKASSSNWPSLYY